MAVNAERPTFAPDTLVRFRRGRILLHTTSSALAAFETGSAMLPGWLGQFAAAASPDAALAQLPAADRAAGAQVVDYLRRSRALITVAAAGPTPAPDEKETQQRTRNHLRLLARSFYEMACDLHGYGPYAERELAGRSGVGVERRLMALLAGVDGLRQELGALREAYLREQLARMGVDAGAREQPARGAAGG
jgi:hypothetical protein